MRKQAFGLLIFVAAVSSGGHAPSSDAVRRGNRQDSQTGHSQVEAGTRQAEQSQIELGREVFTGLAQPPCAVCYTLTDAGVAGMTGPNLDDERPAQADVKLTVTEGVGVMPAYGELLTEEQIDAVAKYVADAAGQAN